MRFLKGQTVVLPGGVFATVTRVPANGLIRVRKLGAPTDAVAWLDQTRTRAEALREAHRLLTRLAEDIEAYALVDLAHGLAAQLELAAQACDRSDALAGAQVIA